MIGRKRLLITPELLVEFLRHPVPPGITAEGLPRDARIVDASYDRPLDCIVLWVESKEFEEYGDIDVLFRQSRGETQ